MHVLSDSEMVSGGDLDLDLKENDNVEDLGQFYMDSKGKRK